MDSTREHRLDALRGVAALSVAIGHCVTTFSIVKQYDKTYHTLNYDSKTEILLRLMHMVFNADAAVIIFFVLSGYVLSKSLSRIQSGYVNEFFIYVVKRLYRIIPPVLISFLPLAYFIDDSAWEYVKNMLLMKVSINGVTWSLQVEVVASLLIFIVFIIKKKLTLLAIPLFIILIVLLFTGYMPLFFRYFPAFFLGCFVGEIRTALAQKKFILPVSIFLLLIADFVLGYGEKTTLLVVTLCSVVVVACINSKIFGFLDSIVFQYLGKVSFSFYLYHYCGVLLTLKLCAMISIPIGTQHEIINIMLLASFSIPIALIIATLSYFFIEKPSISAGQVIVNKIRSISKEQTSIEKGSVKNYV